MVKSKTQKPELSLNLEYSTHFIRGIRLKSDANFLQDIQIL